MEDASYISGKKLVLIYRKVLKSEKEILMRLTGRDLL